MQIFLSIVIFVPFAMWFIGWYVPHLAARAEERSIGRPGDAARTKALGDRLRAAALPTFLFGVVAIVLVAALPL